MDPNIPQYSKNTISLSFMTVNLFHADTICVCVHVRVNEKGRDLPLELLCASHYCN